MAPIQKFSLVYDAQEDRLAWDTEAADGATTRLWLTQRLCTAFAAALIPVLHKAQGAASEHEAVVQSWEQAAAMADFGKVSAVRASAETTAGLVRAAHITPSAQGLDLTFDFGDGDSRTIGLSLAAVRQTLAVMHGLYVAAGWPGDVWPAWIAEPAALPDSSAVN